MDDLDPYRCQPEFSDQILKTLKQFGLHWDESVVYQSQRHDAYQAALDQLDRQQLIYRCDCSRRTLQARPDTRDGSRYDNHCRTRHPSRDYALRVRVTDTPVTCHDQIQPPLTQNLLDELGDFIVYRRDQVYAYHIAVVIDDAAQAISEVFRGFDLLDSTPRQIYLQQQLGLPTPEYAHVPVLVDDQGHKLSKQTFAQDVSTMPVEQTLFNILTWLHQSPPDSLRSATKNEILNWGINHWRMELIPKQPAMDHAVLKALQCQTAPASEQSHG